MVTGLMISFIGAVYADPNGKSSAGQAYLVYAGLLAENFVPTSTASSPATLQSTTTETTPEPIYSCNTGSHFYNRVYYRTFY